ncbi:OmpH family outer membrane protein [Simkania negevensis]|uniref:Skp-like protein n=1 Tax=Simkania negevensis (strain ATCC VR-1471 / DSM 27360 / Z) TaxID=331113 RepID=F8L7G0_SIMNZ|nr:OmpH family outer membrane protein [Simkania negevensis]MCB1075209.1 OmpH family outer membrane protein [Simkania sp.]CCB88693.1 Skp-like protein [Simkania negevensis Z]
MKRHTFFLPILASLFFFLTSAQAHVNSAGIVNFSTCITESKYGKQEQEAFDDIRTKITSIMQDLDGQFRDIVTKLNDPEFVDSLSPEKEHEMQAHAQSLQEELGRYQQQYYQVMNQANMHLIQMMTNHVSHASELIAKKEKFSVVLNKEACFYYEPKQDITAAVIAEMDKNFEKDAKAHKATAATEQPSEKAVK